MSNVQSYNALIDRFKAFASGHFILKTFSHGQIDTADLEKFTEYPFMHVVPSNVTYAKGTKTFSFQIVLADLPRDKDDKVEFQREVLSDLQRIAEDLVAEITNHRVLFGDLITVQNVSLEPFLEEFHNTLTGWTVSLDLLVPYYWDACSIPAEWNDFFESGSGGTGSILTFIDSIVRDENGNVSLVNDEATPSPNYYYGTDDEGVRGWYLLSDEVGLTCETIGSCQTIIDIEAAIDALEEEILLKADITSISAVGFSNDYNDLDNLPAIPAAQVNSDWNATSGVAEILNKPTLPATVGDMLKSVYDTDVDGVVDSAERIQIVVRNSTGSTLTKGQIVYLSGATGNRPNAVLAQANTEATSSKTIGMVIANIANNADGQVAVNGTLHDLDTSAFTAGDTLWLSATTAGGMVANTPPIEPNHAVFIGYVARSHPNQGRVVLAIQNGYELDELHGVLITSPANNNVLTYESSTSLWKNKTVETALGFTPSNDSLVVHLAGTETITGAKTFQNITTITPSTLTGTAATSALDISQTWNTTGTPTAIKLNITDTASNGNSRLLDIQVGGSSKFIFVKNGNLFFGALNNSSNIQGDDSTRGLILRTSLTTTVGSGFLFSNLQGNIANLSSTSNGLGIQPAGSSGFNPTSGTGIYNSIRIFDIINQTGTATGITRGLYVNPTLTAAADFRAIETTVGKVCLNTTSGNTMIGTTTDAGYKLDVNGTARIQNHLFISSGFAVASLGNNVNLRSDLIGGSGYVVNAQSYNTLNSSGNEQGFGLFTGTYAPTSVSGTPSFNALKLTPTINQTGGANGITRGLYINPTLTAAADFRAIEVTNGTTVLAPSVTARASLRIPSGTAPTSPVNGDIWFDGTDIKMRIGGVTKTFTLL